MIGSRERGQKVKKVDGLIVTRVEKTRKQVEKSAALVDVQVERSAPSILHVGQLQVLVVSAASGVRNLREERKDD